MLWFYILIFIASSFLLLKASTWTVRSLTKIARLLKWSEFVVAFLLMAFVTTLPELFVGITSALYQKPQLSFGNIVGSNVVHLTFVVALAVFLSGKLKAKSGIVQKTSFYTGLIVLLPLLLMADKTISRIDGLILLSALVFYFSYLLSQKERFSKALPDRVRNGGLGFKTLFRNLGLFLLGVILLLAATQGIVWSSVHFALSIGWSLVLFGIVLLGLATNLPEITFTIKAVRLGHKEMILGDLMGAVAVNSGLVLGLTALIHPIKIGYLSPYLSGMIFTIIAVFSFALFTRSNKEITRKEGVFLLLVYLAFLTVQLLIGGI